MKGNIAMSEAPVIDAPEVVQGPVVTGPAEPVPAPEPEDELDRLDPIPDHVTLLNGAVLDVLPMKSRQFFKLLRIITRGGANALGRMPLSTNVDTDVFMQQLLALVIFAIPEAENETIEFIYSMVQPRGYESFSDDDKIVANAKLAEELNNPELEDLFTIVEAIVKRESEDLQALGKRLRGLLTVAEKTGQLK